MTREEYNKHKVIIEQWSNGAQVQVYNDDSGWHDVSNPSWRGDLMYRTKPILMITPYSFGDRELMRGRWMRRKSDGCEFLPTGFYLNSVYFLERESETYVDLARYYEFLDGSPIGIIENF